MYLENEIKEKFANLQKGSAFELNNADAWIFMFRDGTYGAAIPYSGSDVNESYANVKFYSAHVAFGSEEQQCLVLSSSLFHLRNEFALICTNFIDPGVDQSNRQTVLADPIDWWRKWQELLGNAVKEKQIHGLLGEMIAVKYLKEHHSEVKWKPTDYSTHDIEAGEQAYEVKSTTSKYDEIISVSSQYQLRDPDYLLFCRFEKGAGGRSIDDVLKELHSMGIDQSVINKEIEALGFPAGSQARKEKFILLEMRLYEVNDDFPGRHLNEFLTNMNDPSIAKVTYDIDLKRVPFENVTEEAE
ncbi:PD-(D/E)XK motif protein [Salisediminibacterium halotolerans]|uniref:PD-(D/E)XK family member n=1 Tax=Salisediminibacterium halotolerans TaxID=517425 RepID=A0A1H9RF99_9BACI|nr:PD-(D/E)XK motif protein [Salisediminibacterium haloalkalitolerans]SER70653.1 Putative PD-(D/E)XK family member [Salisediminibacterium haloalkalitolerans]